MPFQSAVIISSPLSLQQKKKLGLSIQNFTENSTQLLLPIILIVDMPKYHMTV